jgi:glycosyltransferase involved in cell wall biosynthesis
MMTDQPVLLDCTRMLAQHWTGRMPTGIDRVCAAYRAHFAPHAQAVIQLRGRVWVLSRSHSERLFALLDGPRLALRSNLAALAALWRAGGESAAGTADALYLNVSHTDYDLDRHLGWVQRSGVRPVYLLHDLIPIEHPHWTTPHKTRRHAGRVRSALAAASGIIANSHATAHAIHAYARDHGFVAPPILGAPLGMPELPPAPRSFGTPRPTFVCIGTIERRKNHMLLLDVWQRLIARHGVTAPRLLLIGRWGVGSEEVRRRYRADPQLHRFITILSDCPDAEIARHLRGACALLAPSRAEGFGLPLVEALGLGVPVIASDLAPFREVGGGVPTFLDPARPEAWLAAIREFAANGPERRRQMTALKAYRAPGWADHFALVDSWLAALPLRGHRAAPDQAEMRPRLRSAGGRG